MKKKEITGKTKIITLMRRNPDAAEILFDAGLGCIGCSMAFNETIEQGCLAHGMTKKQIEKLIKELNKDDK